MSEAEMIQLLLQWLIAVVVFIGAGALTLLWQVYRAVNALEKDHGARLAVIENRLKFEGAK